MPVERGECPDEVAAEVHHVPRQLEVVRRIGKGGMAEVFLARAHGPLGFTKELALKRILPEFAQVDGFEPRFIRSTNITASLTNANIVQVFDLFWLADSLFIAMELVEGTDLGVFLRAYAQPSAPPAVGDAVFIAIELFKGLAYAHERGVVHRDIRPSNVLLSRWGEVKIADFGIATTQNGRGVPGRWSYTSPEQTRGLQLDARADLFSAGAILFELLTGHRLFCASSPTGIDDLVRAASVPPLSSLRAGLPPDFDELLAKLITSDRDARIEQASDVVAELIWISYRLGLEASSLGVSRTVEQIAPALPRQLDRHAADLLDAVVQNLPAGHPVRVTRSTTRIRPSLLLRETLEPGAAIPAWTVARNRPSGQPAAKAAPVVLPPGPPAPVDRPARVPAHACSCGKPSH